MFGATIAVIDKQHHVNIETESKKRFYNKYMFRWQRIVLSENTSARLGSEDSSIIEKIESDTLAYATMSSIVSESLNFLLKCKVKELQVKVARL